MSALWTLGAVGIYVDGLECDGENILAEIDVIAATTTTLHYYGSKSRRWSIKGHFWNRTNESTLLGYAASSTQRTFSGPFSFSKTLAIKSVKTRRIPDKTGEALSSTGEFFACEIEAIEQ